MFAWRVWELIADPGGQAGTGWAARAGKKGLSWESPAARRETWPEQSQALARRPSGSGSRGARGAGIPS